MPFSAWPAADQASWHEARSKAGPFDDSGKLSSYPAGRLKTMMTAYGRWLGFIAAVTGNVPNTGLENCSDKDLIDRFLTLLRECLAPCTVRAYMSDFSTVCRALAPEQEFRLIQAATRHVWRTARPVSSKLTRMVPARDLYALGFALMTEAPALPTALKRASQYRDGLMIAMMIACPVRLGNFMSIDVGVHLVEGDELYRLHFAGADVKNRRPIDRALPGELTLPIRQWIERYRPECLSRRGRWSRNNAGHALWVSEGGDRYRSGSHVRERIERHTKKRFGKSINPHLFRDIAATSIATEIPLDVEIVATVLGHTQLTTGERYYNQARSVGASMAHQGVVERFRTPSLKEQE